MGDAIVNTLEKAPYEARLHRDSQHYYFGFGTASDFVDRARMSQVPTGFIRGWRIRSLVLFGYYCFRCAGLFPSLSAAFAPSLSISKSLDSCSILQRNHHCPSFSIDVSVSKLGSSSHVCSPLLDYVHSTLRAQKTSLWCISSSTLTCPSGRSRLHLAFDPVRPFHARSTILNLNKSSIRYPIATRSRGRMYGSRTIGLPSHRQLSIPWTTLYSSSSSANDNDRSNQQQDSQTIRTNPPTTRTVGTVGSSMSPILIHIGETTATLTSIAVFLVTAYYRNDACCSFFVGAILNSILSKILKRILQQSRPSLSIRKEAGMPSSHAMTLAFMATYCAIHVRWTTLPLLLYVVPSLVYRIQSALHTWQQVVVGCILGSINATIWYHYICFPTSTTWSLNRAWHDWHVLDAHGQLPLIYLGAVIYLGAATVGKHTRQEMKRIVQSNIEKVAAFLDEHGSISERHNTSKNQK